MENLTVRKLKNRLFNANTCGALVPAAYHITVHA